MKLLFPFGAALAGSLMLTVYAVPVVTSQARSGKVLVAHRGASAYAPEHTAPAYRLAIEQGADYVEQDLAVTRDGVLVSIHDATLERTTNVEELFPDRFTLDAKKQKRWVVADFTLAEIKRLDAGSWFDGTFAGEKILTWDESVDVVAEARPRPDLIVTGNPGCLMQIGAGLRAARLPIGVAHPVELLDLSYDEAGYYG